MLFRKAQHSNKCTKNNCSLYYFKAIITSDFNILLSELYCFYNVLIFLPAASWSLDGKFGHNPVGVAGWAAAAVAAAAVDHSYKFMLLPQ